MFILLSFVYWMIQRSLTTYLFYPRRNQLYSEDQKSDIIPSLSVNQYAYSRKKLNLTTVYCVSWQSIIKISFVSILYSETCFDSSDFKHHVPFSIWLLILQEINPTFLKIITRTKCFFKEYEEINTLNHHYWDNMNVFISR